jgi:hypothetical protein
VLALIGLLPSSAPAAKADPGWATATQGINLANFTIPAQSLGPLQDTTHLARVTVTNSEGATASAAEKVN